MFTSFWVAEIRAEFATSPAFEPVVEWGSDPVVESGVRTCECILARRWQLGDGKPRGRRLEDVPLLWPPVVLRWESYRAANPEEFSGAHRIPESVLRMIVATEYRCEPDLVSDSPRLGPNH
jgi:hypothetical protein